MIKIENTEVFGWNAAPGYRTQPKYDVPNGNIPLPSGGDDFSELTDGDGEVPF